MIKVASLLILCIVIVTVAANEIKTKQETTFCRAIVEEDQAICSITNGTHVKLCKTTLPVVKTVTFSCKLEFDSKIHKCTGYNYTANMLDIGCTVEVDDKRIICSYYDCVVGYSPYAVYNQFFVDEKIMHQMPSLNGGNITYEIVKLDEWSLSDLMLLHQINRNSSNFMIKFVYAVIDSPEVSPLLLTVAILMIVSIFALSSNHLMYLAAVIISLVGIAWMENLILSTLYCYFPLTK